MRGASLTGGLLLQKPVIRTVTTSWIYTCTKKVLLNILSSPSGDLDSDKKLTTVPTPVADPSHQGTVDHLEMLSSNGAYVKVHFNRHAKNSTKITGIYDVNTCYITCLANERCFSVDYNSIDNSCWHSYRQNGCSEPKVKLGSTHFDIRRCCKCIWLTVGRFSIINDNDKGFVQYWTSNENGLL